jgi:hypothetical protein
MDSPADDTAIGTDSNQFLLNLAFDVLGLPAEAVDRVRKIFVLKLEEHLAIESADDFDGRIRETHSTETSVGTNARAANFFVIQLHSKSV